MTERRASQATIAARRGDVDVLAVGADGDGERGFESPALLAVAVAPGLADAVLQRRLADGEHRADEGADPFGVHRRPQPECEGVGAGLERPLHLQARREVGVAGKKLIAGGASPGGVGSLKVALRSSYPDAAQNRWVALADEFSATNDGWDLTVWAVCAKVGS